MEKFNTVKHIEQAIFQNKKLLLQTEESNDFDFILFHPYAVVLDSVEGYYVVGKEEKRKLNFDVQLKRFKVNELTFIEVLDVNFNPDGSLWEKLNHAALELV